MSEIRAFLRRGLAALLSAAILFSAPGLPCYESVAGDMSRPVPVTPVLGAPLAPTLAGRLLLRPFGGALVTLREVRPAALPQSAAAAASGIAAPHAAAGAALPQSAAFASPAAAPQAGSAMVTEALSTGHGEEAADSWRRSAVSARPEFADLEAELVGRHGSAAAAQLLNEPFGRARVDGVSVPDPDNLPVPPAEAPDSLEQASLEVDPQRVYHPSPEDWRDELFYFILVDRFARGKDGQPFGDPRDGRTRHGGDIKGIIERLDYIKGSGATTIMLSPVVMNLPDSYHGYAPIHLMAVDPKMGTMEDFKTLVKEAHARGLRVVMDWVINHSGPVFEYKDGSRWSGLEGPPKEIGEWTYPLKPAEAAKEEHFSRRGVIEPDGWNDPAQATHGDFPPNYRHYASERPETQRLLTHVALWWIKETDIDGVRLDAIRHLAPGFLPKLVTDIRAYAAKLGKDSFFVLGENSTGKDEEIVPFMGPEGIDSAYNYPGYRRENWALHGRAPTLELSNSFHRIQEAFGESAGRLLRFIDNHDTYRYLRSGEPLELLKMAFTYLMLSTGIPLVYYGTEQAFRQDVDRLDPESPTLPADPRNREDMFPDGEFKSESSAGDKFDVNSPIYRHMAKLAGLRKAYPALTRGRQYMRWSDHGGAGVLAFSRILGDSEVVVILNTGGSARSARLWVDAGITPAGTTLQDALDSGYEATSAPSDGGVKITVDVPPHGARVLVRKR